MLSAILRVEFLKEGRSIRLPLLLIFYNSLLAFVTILFIFFNNESTQIGYYAGQSSFLVQFLIISTIEILSVFVLMPFSLTSLGSHEKKMAKEFVVIPGVISNYVMAKIYLLVATNLLIFISSLPIISLSCIYSGISLFKMVRLFWMILLFSFWSGAIAIFSYSINRKMLFAFTGTIFLYLMFSFGIIFFLEVARGIEFSFLQTGTISKGLSALCMILNLFNPITSYVGYYGNVTGNVGIISSYFGNFGIDITTTTFSFLYYKAANVVCICTAIFFIYLSSRFFSSEEE